MTIDFTCQKCEASFELDAQDLIDGTEKLACTQCEAKATAAMTDDFVQALTEMRAQVAKLAARFAVNLAIETEDLEADKDDEDEKDDDDEADDELDFDDDEDEDDDEEDLDDEDAEEK